MGFSKINLQTKEILFDFNKINREKRINVKLIKISKGSYIVHKIRSKQLMSIKTMRGKDNFVGRHYTMLELMLKQCSVL